MAEEINNRNNTRSRKPLKGFNTFEDLAGGKLPPQAPELEEAVLGAMLIDKNAITSVIDMLKPETFYLDRHQAIFNAVKSLYDKQQPCDIITVKEELRSLGLLEAAGGAFYIAQLTNRVASSANIEFHARKIVEKYVERELIRISTETIKNAYDETVDVMEILDDAEKSLYQIIEGNLKGDYSKIDDVISKAIKHIEEIQNKDSGISGVPSGFKDLDTFTAGWQPGALLILAARPGMGKTSFALSVARNAAVDFKCPVAVFSLEMSSVELVHRLLSAEAELPMEKFKRGTMEPWEWEQLNKRITGLQEAKIFIDDTPGISIFELRAKCRRLKSHEGIKMVIVDYLQLMSGGESRTMNREQEISMISRSLKGLAKELELPIIALSQLNRDVEKRADSKKPMLSDLRESGSIEQDADAVMFIYRPEQYGLKDIEIYHEDGTSTMRDSRGVAEIIFAKHRSGKVGSVFLKFISSQTRFADLESAEGFASLGSLGPATNFDSGGGMHTITLTSKASNQHDDEESPF